MFLTFTHLTKNIALIYWVRIQLGGIQMNLKKLNLLPVNIQLFADGTEGDDDIEIDVEDLFNDTGGLANLN